MQETLRLAFTYVRMVWRFRWLALVSAFCICTVGWAWIVMMPDVYEVKTRVYLDTRSLLKPLLKGLAVNTDVNRGTVNLMRRTLLVRPNLEEVARKTDMDLRAETPEAYEGLMKSLKSNITVAGTSKDNIFLIGYTNENPKLATKVVESVLNIFVEKSLGDTRKDTSTTRQFLERQIAEYESRLDAADERLKEFKQRNVGLMPSEGGNYHQRLGSANGQLANEQQRHRELTARMNTLKAQIEGQVPTFGLGPTLPSIGAESSGQVMSMDTSTHLDGRIDGLQAKLNDLSLQYTDKHPDVMSSQRLLESMESERKQILSRRRAELAANPPPQAAAPNLGAAQSDIQANPVYQQLKIEYGMVAAEAAVVAERVKRQQGNIESLQSRVETIFKVEAELKRLNRDHQLNRKNYEALISRRESLKLGEEAGQSTDGVQFNILEPPREPIIPIGPDRAKLSSAVLLLSIGAGVGLALLLAMVRPGIYSKEGLLDVTDLPVLGSLSRIWTRRERFRRRMEVISFAGACMFLVAVFGGLMALYAAQVNIQEKLLSLGERFL